MIKRSLLLIVFLLGLFVGLRAQTDTVFWFAPPDLEINHQQIPIRLCFTTYGSAATITVEQPTNSAFPTTIFTVPADSFYVLDVSNWVDDIESKPANTVLNRGFRISASDFISCYYESVGGNSEMYTLKGSSGLGTDFLVPMQVAFNSHYSSSTSSIEIIATENNTMIQITAPVALQGGIAAGSTVTVTLQRGQTYVVRAAGTSASNHLHNTVIHSSKPVAVNSSDDSVESGWGCFDLIGDQLVPVNMTGNRYVAIRNYSSYDDGFEKVFVFPLNNNTTVWFNGVPQTVSQGNFIEHPLTDTATLITSNNPIIVFQITATGCEQGGTMLPHLECTGSYSVSHLRPNIESMIVSLVTETLHTGNFTLNGNPNIITAADFHPLANDPTLSYCLKDISNIVPTGTVMKLANSSGRFHLGILDGDGSGSCSYGFFSDYARSSYVRFEMDSLYCVGDSIVFHYSAPNVDNLVLTGPNGFQLTTPPFGLANADSSMSGWYYLEGTDTSGCLTILSDSIQLRVITCLQPNFPDNVDSATCTFLSEGTEWGIRVEWSSDPIVSNLNIPLVGDLDNDGHPEVVCFANQGDINIDPRRNNILLVFDGVTRQLKQTINLPSYVTAFDAAAYGLVKLPNQKGLIVVACYDYKLRAYDITSASPETPYWISDVDFGVSYADWAVNVSFADFNCDGHPEVYVRNKIYNAETGVLLASANSQNTGSSFAHWTHNTNYKLSSPYAADVTGGNELELILGNEVYSVSINNINGQSGNSITLAKQITPPGGATADGHAQVADFNSDGYLDIFISVRSTHSSYGTVYGYVWDIHNDTVSNPIVIQTSWSGKSFATIADIDNDGLLEVLIQSGVQGSSEKFRAYKYDPSSMSFSLMWGFAPNEDSFSNAITAFDFNQDGILELLICDQSMVRIVNGSGISHITHIDTIPVYTMNSFPFSETTIMQYPVIVDVDADGSAEFVSVGSSRLNFFKSSTTPWAPARKVWNQYLYNVTNVNENLTIPQHLFNNATPFTDPQGVVRTPFNNFLQQATSIDQYGRPFYAVPDVAMNQSASSQMVGDSLVLQFSYCNLGDNILNAPYPVTVFLNAYGGDTLCTVLVNNSLPADSCVEGEIRLPLNELCNLPIVDAFVITVNCACNGIAQNGGLQPECDTTNNTATVTIHIEPTIDSTYISMHACDTLTWNGILYDSTGVYVQTLSNMYGCDSVVVIDLTVSPTNLTQFVDSICQNTAYNGYGFSLSEDETATSGFHTFDRTLANQFGCDSVIRLNLYVKPVITPEFYANPDRAMLSENPTIYFVNNTNIVELAQTNYYWVWDFGDGTSDTTTEAENSHLYTNWGDYTVTLALWADGCMDTASVSVFIEADLEFPNVITPNGDGINDVFVIKNLNPDRPNKLYIADRWGKVVWHKDNYQTYMKDEQIYNAESGFGMGNISDGVYYFSFYYEGAVRTVRFNGSITVIR